MALNMASRRGVRCWKETELQPLWYDKYRLSWFSAATVD